MEKKKIRSLKEEIEKIASRYDLQIIYAFGSRAKEALDLLEGRIERFSSNTSDLDIGIKAKKHLNVDQKVEIALFFEELFNISRVDLVVLSEAPIFLALDIVTGEILYAEDPTYEAEYQLYIMRQAAELLPYEIMRERMILGDEYDSWRY